MTYDERFAVQSPHLSSCNVWQPRIVARIRTKGDVRCHSYDCSIGTNKTSHVRAVTCGSQAVSSVCRHEFQPLASAEVIVTWEESSRIPMCNEGRELWARVALFRAAWFASSIRSDHQQLNRWNCVEPVTWWKVLCKDYNCILIVANPSHNNRTIAEHWPEPNSHKLAGFLAYTSTYLRMFSWNSMIRN